MKTKNNFNLRERIRILIFVLVNVNPLIFLSMSPVKVAAQSSDDYAYNNVMASTPGETAYLSASNATDKVAIVANGSKNLYKTDPSNDPAPRNNPEGLLTMAPLGHKTLSIEDNSRACTVNKYLYLSVYQDIWKLFAPGVFEQLNAVDKYSIYLMVTSGKPYIIFESSVNGWSYKTGIITNDIKMTMHFSNNGTLIKVVKRSR